MIRVDEIYNNVFWKWMQNNKIPSRLFFCDPPGETSPSSLFNLGNNYTTEKGYLFFHDQEPIHLDIHEPLFNEVIRRNSDIDEFWVRSCRTAICLDTGAVVVSEKNSDNLDKLLTRYNWKSYYYFYHGWAALDWYRGYHRTFLIPRARDRVPTTAFISPNRIIGGKRDHRVLFLYHIFKNSLENNYITCPKVCPEENVSVNDVAIKYTTQYPDIFDMFNNANLPYLFKDEDTQVMSSCWITNFNESADSVFYVPTETVYFGRRWHLTEKTFKPIALEMPFILVAPAGSLEYLRSYGFKTFNGIIDESYDEETDDIKRLEKVTQLLVEINNITANEKLQLHKQCLSIVEYNYNHFYFGNFEKILWKELTDMTSTWK